MGFQHGESVAKYYSLISTLNDWMTGQRDERGCTSHSGKQRKECKPGLDRSQKSAELVQRPRGTKQQCCA